MSEVAMEAKGLSAGYNGDAVVRGIDLSIRSGQVAALLGANGAGRTTTLKCLVGAIPPLSGQILLDGVPVAEPVHRMARRGVSIVPEERAVFTQLTVRENLRAGRSDIERALTLFPELKPLLKRSAGVLSGGEQQMLTLGRALSREPKVLLVDELSLGLAPLVVERLIEALRVAATEAGIAVLLVEQHVKQALGIADRVYVMTRGSIVLEGTPSEVAPELERAYLGGNVPSNGTGVDEA